MKQNKHWYTKGVARTRSKQKLRIDLQDRKRGREFDDSLRVNEGNS